MCSKRELVEGERGVMFGEVMDRVSGVAGARARERLALLQNSGC